MIQNDKIPERRTINLDWENELKAKWSREYEHDTTTHAIKLEALQEIKDMWGL